MLFMLSGNVQRILGNMNLERHFVHVFRTIDNSLQMEDNQAAVKYATSERPRMHAITDCPRRHRPI